MSRLTDSWKKTLNRKLSLRRSGKVKRLTNRSRQMNYALPFDDALVYFELLESSTSRDQDHELYQKIDHEMRMRDGSAKMLAAAKHTLQQLEAAKALHTSNCRMEAYMEHLQLKNSREIENAESVKLGTKASKAERLISSPEKHAQGTKHTPKVECHRIPCKAKVSISEIRVPLMWKDTDHFKNKGNYRRFTVFCMVRIGTDVYETELVSEVDRLTTDVSFNDVITLDNATHDFECQLQIYAYEHHEDLTIASTQVKLKKRISDISNTVGRRLSGFNLKESFDMQSLPGPKFHLVAESTLKLSDAGDRISSFDLITKDQDVGLSLPLFGNFCCRFAVQPHCLVNETVSGFLYVKEDTDWVKYWCSLQNLKISCWNSQFEADVQDPLTMIPVTKESIISDMDPGHAERSHSIYIENRAHKDRWELAAQTASSLADWWSGLEQQMLDQVVWQHACETLMEIHRDKGKETPYLLRERRAGSLYDKTRVKRGQRLQLSDQTGQEDSPLTLAFKRYTKDSKDGRSSPLARNNSCPK
ncbi:rhotekin-2-like [Watersipora subatra]|uniref:rhotekin-2-like n=1 Tax=Watersipora subatra TaxID=2589382 RepID=UPI00355C8695